MLQYHSNGATKKRIILKNTRVTKIIQTILKLVFDFNIFMVTNEASLPLLAEYFTISTCHIVDEAKASSPSSLPQVEA